MGGHIHGVLALVWILFSPPTRDDQKFILYDHNLIGNGSAVKTDLPLGYCSIWHKTTPLSVQCDELNRYYDNLVIASGGVLDESIFNIEIFRYCSFVNYHKNNETVVASSVLCTELEKIGAINLQVDKCRLTDIKWQCSICDGNTSEATIIPKKPLFDNSHASKDASQPIRKYLSHTESHSTFLYILSFFGFLVTLFTFILNKSYSQVSPIEEWARIQEEYKLKSEEIFKLQEEKREFQRRIREEMKQENGRSIQQNFMTFISSITQTLAEETRNFNEWAQTPD